MTSLRAALTILTAALAALLLAVPAGASAQVACGDIITRDTTLTEDLSCDEADSQHAPDGGWRYALLIAADDVTLNLNGHQVNTDGMAIGVYGQRRVTIRNGASANITLVDTTDSRLSQLTPVGAGWVSLQRSDRNHIKASDVRGISLWHSNDNRISDSSSIGEGGGVSLYASDRNRIRRNTLCAGMGYPLFVDQSNDNLIRHNTVPDGGECSFRGPGMSVTADSAGNRLIANTVTGIRDYDGIKVDSPNTTLIRNTANFNGAYGIAAVPGVKSGINYASGNANPAQCLNVRCSSTGR
jgi:parallel beta-helix repeat protein